MHLPLLSQKSSRFTESVIRGMSIEAAKHPKSPISSESSTTTRVDVPRPDLSRFDQLLGHGDDSPVSVFYA